MSSRDSMSPPLPVSTCGLKNNAGAIPERGEGKEVSNDASANPFQSPGTNDMDGEKELMDIKELADRTGLSVSTLRRFVRQRQIPFLQPAGKGGKILFPFDVVSSLQTNVPAQQSAPTQRSPLAGRRPNWTKP